MENFIKLYRCDKGIDPFDLARRIGLNDDLELFAIERGDKDPDIETIIKLVHELSTPVGVLFPAFEVPSPSRISLRVVSETLDRMLHNLVFTYNNLEKNPEYYAEVEALCIAIDCVRSFRCGINPCNNSLQNSVRE